MRVSSGCLEESQGTHDHWRTKMVAGDLGGAKTSGAIY
jgi:hypothetical protein